MFSSLVKPTPNNKNCFFVKTKVLEFPQVKIKFSLLEKTGTSDLNYFDTLKKSQG